MTPKQKELTMRNGSIKALHDTGMTLQEIGDQFDITRERVRQILDRYYDTRRNKLSTMALRRLDKQEAPR